MSVDDRYMCLVCGYYGLGEPARTATTHADESCPACGFEFGYDDDDQHVTYDEWRRRWIDDGMRWSGGLGTQPPDWNPVAALTHLGLPKRLDFVCFTCGFDGLPQPPYGTDGHPSFDICPSCGYQFGWTELPPERWRAEWISEGCPWWSRFGPPTGWSAQHQLARVDIGEDDRKST